MTTKPPLPAKEGRLARNIRAIKQIHAEPRSVVGMTRNWLLDLWLAKGGGFYGLGFVITFIILEVRFFVGDLSSSSSVADFVAQEALELVFRIGYQSIINLVMAAIWPVLVLDRLGAWAFAILIAGYLGFEYLLRPLLEGWMPELREARLSKENRKREKQQAKRLKKANKNAK